MAERTPQIPRRSRRGLATLSLALAVSALVSVVLLFWQIGEARAMRDGEARLVVAAAEARAYTLHHWLHEARDDPGFVPPASGEARRLTVEEVRGLASHPASPPGDRFEPRGWTLTEMIALPEGQGTGEPLPHGIVAIEAKIDGERQRRQRDLIRNTLAAGRPDAAAQLVQTAPETDFDPGHDIAIFAWPYGRVDPRLVLRSRRAGHPAPHMTSELKMDGNNVIDVGVLETTGTGTISGEMRTGEITVAGTVNTGSGTEAGAGLSVTGLARAGNVDVEGALAFGTAAGLERLTAKGLEVEDSFRCGACP